jgi:alpha-1,3-mannosyltransferase
MSTLLYLPGLLLILFKRGGPIYTLRHLLTALLIQCLLALPFLQVNPWSYLHNAFDLGRVFLYKWTVNWRFIPEEIFLSPGWAKSLLVGHASVLIAFAVFRWCRRDGGAWVVLDRGLRRPGLPTCVIPVNPDRRFMLFLCESDRLGITQMLPPYCSPRI